MSKICIGCIGDAALRELLEASKKVRCAYCGEQQLGLPLEELADIVDDPLRQYMQKGEMYPTFASDSDRPDWEQEGEPLEYVLQEELGVDYEAARDLANILIENDPAWPPDGEELFYESDQGYRRVHLPSSEYDELWGGFARGIKHEGRFFVEDARRHLAEILGERGSSKALELPTLEIGPGLRHEVLFRARRLDSQQDVRTVLENPASELGPPPERLAVAGRMNAAGIAVFYGALSRVTAVAEVRPYVGSLVVVGGFRPNRRLKLLDLSRIGEGFTGSIFSPEYPQRAARRRFLDGFHTRIARPVHPQDEPLEYIPTQAVAEYVAKILVLDGILYASAQVGAVPEVPEPRSNVRIHELPDEELARHNVVVLGRGSRVVSERAAETVGHPVKPDGCLALEPASVHTVSVNGVQYSYERVYVIQHDDIARAPF